MGLISRVSSRTYRIPASKKSLLSCIHFIFRFLPPSSTMTNSDSHQSPLEQYLVPLAVCGSVCLAAFFYMKNSISTPDLPAFEEAEAPAKKSKKPKKKTEKKKSTSVSAEKEEPVEAAVEETPAVEEKTAPKKGKTGAEKRKAT